MVQNIPTMTMFTVFVLLLYYICILMLTKTRAQPANLMVNGGCENTGAPSCLGNALNLCFAGGWFLTTTAACGVRCSGNTRTVLNFNGWTNSLTNYGWGCTGAYLNSLATAQISGPYSGGGFLAVLQSPYGTLDFPVIEANQTVPMPSRLPQAVIDAGLVFYNMSWVMSSQGLSATYLYFTMYTNTGRLQATVLGGNLTSTKYDYYYNSYYSALFPYTNPIIWTPFTYQNTVMAGTVSIQVVIGSFNLDPLYFSFSVIDEIALYIYTSACLGYPALVPNSARSANCNNIYTPLGRNCTMICNNGYRPIGNLNATCNPYWSSSSLVDNAWINATGSCIPNSKSASHRSHSHRSHSHSHRSHSKSHRSRSHRSLSHKSHSKSHRSHSRSKSHKSHSHSKSFQSESKSVSLSSTYPHYITNHTNNTYCTSYTSELYLQGTSTLSCGASRCICTVDAAYFGIMAIGTCNISQLHVNQTCNTNLTTLVHNRCFNQNQCSFQWGVDFGPPANCSLGIHQQATFFASGQCCNCISWSKSHSVSKHSESLSRSRKSHSKSRHSDSRSRSHKSHSHSHSKSHKSGSHSKSHKSESRSHSYSYSHSKSHKSDSHSKNHKSVSHSRSKSHDSHSHSKSHRSDSHSHSHSKSHRSHSHSHSRSHISESHSTSRKSASLSHRSKSNSHKSESHSKSHRSHSDSHSYSKSHRSESHSKSHKSHSHSHSKSHESESHSKSHHSESHSHSHSDSHSHSHSKSHKSESLSKSHESDSHSHSKSHQSESHSKSHRSESHSDSDSKSHRSDSHSVSHHSHSHQSDSRSRSHESKSHSHSSSKSHKSHSHSHSKSHKSESKSGSKITDSHSHSHSKSHKSDSHSKSHSKSHRSHSRSDSVSHSTSHKSRSHQTHSHSSSHKSRSKSHSFQSRSVSHQSDSQSTSMSASQPQCPQKRQSHPRFDVGNGTFCFSLTTLVYPDLSFSLSCGNHYQFCGFNYSYLGNMDVGTQCFNATFGCRKNMLSYINNQCLNTQTCNLSTKQMLLSNTAPFTCGSYTYPDISLQLVGFCCNPSFGILPAPMIRTDLFAFDHGSEVSETDDVPVCPVQIEVTALPLSPNNLNAFTGVTVSAEVALVNGVNNTYLVNVSAQMVVYLTPYHQQLANNVTYARQAIQPAVLFVNGCSQYQRASSISRSSAVTYAAVPYSRDFTVWCKQTYQSNLPLTPYWQYDVTFNQLALPSTLTASATNASSLAIVMMGLLPGDFFYIDQITIGYSDGTIVYIPTISCDNYTLYTYRCTCNNYYKCDNFNYISGPIMFDNGQVQGPDQVVS